MSKHWLLDSCNWLSDKVKMTDGERLQLKDKAHDIVLEVDKKVATGMKPSDAVIAVVEERLKLIRKG